MVRWEDTLMGMWGGHPNAEVRGHANGEGEDTLTPKMYAIEFIV